MKKNEHAEGAKIYRCAVASTRSLAVAQWRNAMTRPTLCLISRACIVVVVVVVEVVVEVVVVVAVVTVVVVVVVQSTLVHYEWCLVLQFILLQ